MRAADVKQGHFYVNWSGALMREVVSETGHDTVHWMDYSLERKKHIGRGICSKRQLARWAEREATAEEIARVSPQGTA